MKHSLYTIGYERRSPDELVSALHVHGVRTLLDVRLRPNSRKHGFAKSALKERCEAEDIRYIHDRRLGTPPEMMAHVKSGAGYDWETSEAYRSFLRTQTDALNDAVEIVTGGPTCLLCFERSAADCHRRVVAEELAARTGLVVTHIG